MKTISFAQMKGGTGKTTVAYNLSCKLAETQKVLVIDFDQQCNISSDFCFDIFDESAATVADIFENIETDPLDIVIPAPIPELPNLDLIPSTMYLNGTEQLLFTRAYREQAMSHYIEKNKNFFQYYDYVIFDTGPNVGIINQNAFFVSDHIILVSDPDVNAAQAAHVFLRLWNTARSFTNIPDHVDGLIINNVERTKISSKMNDFVDSNETLSKIRLKHTIPHTTRFKECREQNKPIHLLKTKSKDEENSRQRAENAVTELITEMKEKGLL